MIDWPAERERFIREFVEPGGYDPAFPVPARMCGLIESELNNRIWPNVLDLGSGFSSIALRLIDHASVVTADHDARFMAEVEDYAAGRGLAHGVWGLLEEIYEDGDKYDLILVDQGPNEWDRVRELPRIVELVAEHGTIWLDDCHKKHGGALEAGLKEHGFTLQRIPTESRNVGCAMRRKAR